MGKMVVAFVLFVTLLRTVDMYLFYGKYTDAAVFVTMQVLQSFGP